MRRSPGRRGEADHPTTHRHLDHLRSLLGLEESSSGVMEKDRWYLFWEVKRRGETEKIWRRLGRARVGFASFYIPDLPEEEEWKISR